MYLICSTQTHLRHAWPQSSSAAHHSSLRPVIEAIAWLVETVSMFALYITVLGLIICSQEAHSKSRRNRYRVWATINHLVVGSRMFPTTTMSPLVAGGDVARERKHRLMGSLWAETVFTSDYLLYSPRSRRKGFVQFKCLSVSLWCVSFIAVNKEHLYSCKSMSTWAVLFR